MKFSAALLSLVALGATQAAQASDWSQLLLPHEKPPQLAAAPFGLLAPNPAYQEIFRSVDKARILTLLQQVTGGIPVTVEGRTFSITNRYTPADKANFRAFWKQYFTQLGIPVQEMAYPTRHRVGEREGHNLEAVLPGKSPDSLVVLVHYDSIGPGGREASNPGVDDDMTGMVILMETARILAEHKGQLQRTVRFVATDYEEHGQLEGARQYAAYLKKLAAEKGFQLVAAIDNEQSGWNCSSENMCFGTGGVNKTFDVFSCSGDSRRFDSRALGDALQSVVEQYAGGALAVNRDCLSDHSDHYAMWEIGVPSVVFSEHEPFNNPHFDGQGGDTFDKVDQDYYFHIAQVGVTFAATVAGLE